MSEFPYPGSATPQYAAGIQPPWEDTSRPIFERWWATVRGVLFAPTEFFASMRQEAGIGAPLVFAIIGGWIGAVFSQFYSMILNMVTSAATAGSGEEAIGAVIGSGGLFVCALVLGPVAVVIGSFIGAGILHLCLMIVGGANRPFETTFRVLTYASGATSLFGVVPLCGGAVAGIWALVAEVIGLSRAHQIGVGRAVIAVLIPIVVICGCLGALFGSAIIALIASQTGQMR